MNRRHFISSTAIAAAALPLRTIAQSTPQESTMFKSKTSAGLGGVAIGNAVQPTSDEDAQNALRVSWDNGVRMFDTAPFYGYGISERRFGHFLSEQPREEYFLSTKVGRLLRPDPSPDGKMWKDVPNFSPQMDYSASGARRSIEDSLQRLGIESIDITYIHDLSPDFLGDEWTEHFEVARKGAMVELAKMKSEGLIKAWGFGVNTLPPILKTLEVAEPDVFLSACQYSLVYHDEAVEKLLPAVAEKNVSLVIGAPLNFGFLAGRDRYNYDGTIPDGMMEKRSAMTKIAERHDVDLRTAALQFSLAPENVTAVIPGARNASQAEQNAKSFEAKIPVDFWAELKQEKLISEAAETPA